MKYYPRLIVKRTPINAYSAENYKYVREEADRIFIQIYNKLPWYLPNKVTLAKTLSVWHTEQLRTKMTNTNNIVISKSEKKLGVINRWFLGILECLDSISGIEKIPENVEPLHGLWMIFEKNKI